MGSKAEYDEARRERNLREDSERAMIKLGLELQSLLERFVVAVEKIAANTEGKG